MTPAQCCKSYLLVKVLLSNACTFARYLMWVYGWDGFKNVTHCLINLQEQREVIRPVEQFNLKFKPKAKAKCTCCFFGFERIPIELFEDDGNGGEWRRNGA